MSADPAAGGGDPEAPGPDGPPAEGEQPEPAWTRLIAPLRSEDAAFRMVVWAAGAALVLVAIVLLARLLIG